MLEEFLVSCLMTLVLALDLVLVQKVELEDFEHSGKNLMPSSAVALGSCEESLVVLLVLLAC